MAVADLVQRQQLLPRQVTELLFLLSLMSSLQAGLCSLSYLQGCPSNKNEGTWEENLYKQKQVSESVGA